jgi:hypothetical protein
MNNTFGPRISISSRYSYRGHVDAKTGDVFIDEDTQELSFLPMMADPINIDDFNPEIDIII